MLALNLTSIGRVALIGAHCDDLAIGAGATLLSLCRANPGVAIDALVLTGATTVRETEERSALAAFCPGATVTTTVCDFRDGRLPGEWAAVKSALNQWRLGLAGNPELVLAPHTGDAHQDHRLLGELTWQEFRDHQVWGYEILKYEGDLPWPQLHVPISPEHAAEKVALLHQHYPSQHDRSWFDDEAFLGLMRVRGVQCQQRYAEAFLTPKLTVEFTEQRAPQTGAPS